MNKTLVSALSLLLVISLTACATGEVRSSKPRLISQTVSPDQTAELVQGNSAFAFDLYQALRKQDGNLFFSPQSISTALSMTYAGARGETERQMAETLHFTLPQEQLHPAFNSLDLALNSRGQGAKGKDGEPFRLNMINAIWGQKGANFKPEFLDVMAKNYGAGLRTLDFVKNPESARVTINNWVSGQTENRIKDLIPPSGIDSSTVLVLTNAIYFNAGWLHPFDEYPTDNAPFDLLDGKQVNVPMMKQAQSFGYTKGEGYQALELPYDGKEISMVLILPDSGRFQAFESGLNAQQADNITKNLTTTKVWLGLPSFEFSSEFKLNGVLSEMGMPNAFGGADFSGIADAGLFISGLFHKAFVAVDEKGTEAAAATAVVLQESGPAYQVALTFNRPFVFLIRDIQTGAILFVGRVVNPLAK